MNRSAQSAAALQRVGTIATVCGCCGELFQARSVHAAWCSNACRRRAAYYRRSGRSIPPKNTRWTRPIRPQVVQPEILPATPSVSALDACVWNDTPIQRRSADGYVNATAMCKANGCRWTKFRESTQCKAQMQAIAAEDRISVFDLVVSQRGGSGAGGSTWIHPDLATELARWISPAFGLFINRWFRLAVESGQLATFTPTPQLPQLTEGVHVVAPTRRRAAELWWEAIQSEVTGTLARRLNPTHRADTALPLAVAYSWQPGPL
jgi:hypothetical protein